MIEPNMAHKLAQSSTIREWLTWHKLHKSIHSREYDLCINQLEQALEDNNQLTSQRQSLLHHPNTILSIAVLASIFSLFTLIFMLQNRYISNSSDDSASSFVTMPFTGVLKNIDGTVVDTKRDVIFRLYPSEWESQPVYIGECIGEKGLTPEYDGSFTIVLGSDCGMVPITQELLDTYNSLYLGVQIGSDSEITPRTLISTGAQSDPTQGGADFAEYFETEHKDLFTKDMIVGINTDGIFPAITGDRVIGVTTDTPGFIGNSQNNERYTSILVGLVGQVTVLITNENGPIHRGDTISVGNIPGYGVKSISHSSEKIGIALENGEDVTFTQDTCGLSKDNLTCGKIRILLDTAR